jgi:hypothetical protein
MAGESSRPYSPSRFVVSTHPLDRRSLCHYAGSRPFFCGARRKPFGFRRLGKSLEIWRRADLKVPRMALAGWVLSSSDSFLRRSRCETNLHGRKPRESRARQASRRLAVPWRTISAFSLVVLNLEPSERDAGRLKRCGAQPPPRRGSNPVRISFIQVVHPRRTEIFALPDFPRQKNTRTAFDRAGAVRVYPDSLLAVTFLDG